MSTQALSIPISGQRPRSTRALIGAAEGIAVGLSAERNEHLAILMNKEGFKQA